MQTRLNDENSEERQSTGGGGDGDGNSNSTAVAHPAVAAPMKEDTATMTKTTMAHMDILAAVLLQWQRRQQTMQEDTATATTTTLAPMVTQ